MKVVILGIGETGYYLAQILSGDGHDIVVVDKDDKKLEYAREHLDVQLRKGSAANTLVLEPLIDESTDLLLAVTDNDEVNMLATMIARKFGVKRAIARVSDPTNLIHPLLTEDPQVSLLNAEIAVAKGLARLVGNPSADEIEFFANGKAEMMRLHVADEAEVAFKPLRNLKTPRSWLFVAIIRKGEFSVVSGDSIVEPGDHLLVIGDPQKSREIEELLGLDPVKVRRVILVGYNEISSRLAKTFRKKDIAVRLIEDNKELAEKASADLDGVLVFHGEGSSDEILDQAGIDQTDYLFALTSDDENNVLISLLAKERGVHRVIALAQKRQYKPIAEKIGIDSVVNPRSAIVDEIVRFIHHKDLSGLNILEGGKGRMMEFIVKKKTKAVDTPLSKVKLPKQTLIGAIVHDDKLIIPRGEDRIRMGDHVVVFTTRSVLSEVKRLFSD